MMHAAARFKLISGSQVRALVRRPRKPRVSGTTPNSAFLRGFPTTHFPDFCLCERSPILVEIFDGLSLHPKIPFPAAGLGYESDRACSRNSAFCAAVIQGSRVGAAIIPD